MELIKQNPHVLKYSSKDLHTNIFKTLDSLREKEDFCDLVICIGNSNVMAHRCLLAASSKFFSSLLKGK